MGCLVTEEAQFQQVDNFPPSIESRSGEHPLTEVIEIDLEKEQPSQSIVFDVQIRDPNVTQTLFLKAFKNNDFTGEIARAEIPPDDPALVSEMEARVRDVQINVPRGPFQVTGCHRLELRVSSNFEFEAPAEPAQAGDLGTAVWWIFTKDSAKREFDPVNCPRQP
jgi:hypothetical protein